MDIAYANLEVPIVPDSSAPIIEIRAPTPTTTAPNADRSMDPPKTLVATAISGAGDEAKVC